MKRCRFLSLLLVLILLFSFSGTTVSAKSKKVAISDKKITIEVGETYQLSVTNTKVTPAWGCSNNNAVVDENGLVTGCLEGTCKVTAYIDNKKYSCTVTIENSTKTTFVLENNEYTEYFAEAINNTCKKADVDISDDQIVVTIPDNELVKYKKNNAKLFRTLMTAYFDVENDGEIYDLYEKKGAIESKDALRKLCMPTVVQAYLNGHTERDIIINIHPYVDPDSEQINSLMTYDSSVDNVEQFTIPPMEVIFADSEEGI